MGKYRIKYLIDAKNDLDEIYAYLANDDLELAIQAIENIIDNIRKLETYPLLGKPASKKIAETVSYRQLIVSPYVVFYQVIDDEVFIYRILHIRRNLSKILRYI